MSYATPADLVARKDQRTLADLASDTGTPSTDVLTDPVIQAALDDASGKVESALMNGQLYSLDDIAGFTGNSLALLKRITCEVAMAYLLARRPGYDEDGYKKALDAADEWLNQIRKGERVFGDATSQLAASVPSIDGPTALKYEYLNLIPDRTRNTYPNRGQRLPLGRATGL